MNVFNDRGLGTIGRWLDGLARRREAVADNIANIDTPGYRRREVNFEVELRRAMGGDPRALRTTDPRHIAASRAPAGFGVERVQELVSSRRDGNTVSIDEEMVLLSETQLRYQAATTALGRKLAALREVIRSY
ncbi:MAG: flagellar basal body rod protein FlgB [Dehalococcoidia bacterium]